MLWSSMPTLLVFVLKSVSLALDCELFKDKNQIFVFPVFAWFIENIKYIYSKVNLSASVDENQYRVQCRN